MEYTPPKPARRNVKRIMLLAVGSLAVIGLIGYGTVTVLRTIKAPTISGTTQPQTTTPTTPAVELSPEKALESANKARTSAIEKAAAGDQKAALVDYKSAYENYKIAKDSALADETKFTIDSIEAALAVPEHPATSVDSKTSSKE